MKRSRDGRIIHRDDCHRARSAPHWGRADGMSDDEMFARILHYPWLSLCKGCFGGTHVITVKNVGGAR